MYDEYSCSQKSCPVCGESRTEIKDGFKYCIECGTRSAESQPIFDYSSEHYMLMRKQNVRAEKTNYKDIWSSWHGYNTILFGLTNELGSCGTNLNELKKTTLKLWGLYLQTNEIAFYSTASKPPLPKLLRGFQKKDLEYLYEIKKPKKERNQIEKKPIERDNLTLLELKKERLSIKRNLMRKQYKNAVVLSQESDINSQTLHDLKIPDEIVPSNINLHKKTKADLLKLMSKKQIDEHCAIGFCSTNCKCLFKKKLKSSHKFSFDCLSIFNLYTILALALRVNKDNIHIGDMLRWIREGHITFGKYKHFLPDEIRSKQGNPQFFINANLTNIGLRKNVANFGRKLKINSIKGPDIKSLIERYLQELQLPLDMYNFVFKLVEINGHIQNYSPQDLNCLPNYEANAISYIIVALKIIFGLDGITENKISEAVERINSLLSLDKKKKKLDSEIPIRCQSTDKDSQLKFFEWKSWVKYIEYRKICIGQYHYPTKIRIDPNNCSSPELFLHHKKTMMRDLVETVEKKDQKHSVLKTLLEDINRNYKNSDMSFPTFSCSLYPMSSYLEHLLIWSCDKDVQFDRQILEEDFTNYRLSFAFQLNYLKNLLKNKKVNLQIIHHREAFGTRPSNFFERHLDVFQFDINQDVRVINVVQSKQETIELSEMVTNILIESSKNEFSDVITVKSIHDPEIKFCPKAQHSEIIRLNICYKDYWVQHYPELMRFRINSFESELDQYFPASFVWLLRECASLIEMSTLELYKEVCDIETICILKK